MLPALAVLAFASPAPKTVTIIGTTDLHGRLHTLPLFAGYLQEVRAQKGHTVVLLDAGDAMQGTLESDLDEGQTVMKVYAALGYDALAVGNHEFDYGPVGPRTTVSGGEGDPRGALRARAAEVAFPFLAANLFEKGEHVSWPHFQSSALISRDGLKIGLIGASTEDTAKTTISANFSDLEMKKIAGEVALEAEALRKKGATIVILAAHAGGSCKAFKDPNDTSSCAKDSEIFDVARALPPGIIDAIVAGHSHAGIAHFVAGIPVVEAFSQGKAFSRIDLSIDDTGAVQNAQIFPPTQMEKGGTYEGKVIKENPKIAAIIAPALARAETRKKDPLGPTLEKALTRSYDAESPLGNFIATMLLEADGTADIALMNGGGIRADLAKGPLSYGALYNAMPFDNRLTIVKQDGKATKQMFTHNIQATDGVLSIAGARVVGTCVDGKLHVDVFLKDKAGKESLLDDKRSVTIVTSDFLATGGDAIMKNHERTTAVDAIPIREAVVNRIKTKAPSFDPAFWYDEAKPRLHIPSKRPVLCGKDDDAVSSAH